MRGFIAGLLFLSLLLVAIGSILVVVFHGPPEDRVSDVVPGAAALYMNIFVEPSTSQGRAFRNFVNELDGRDVSSTFEEALTVCGVTSDQLADGDATQIGIFVMGDGATGCVTDADLSGMPSAREVRGRWVMGDESALAEADRTVPVNSLGAADDYTSILDRVPADRIALFFKRGSGPWLDEDVDLSRRILRDALPSGVIALTSSGRTLSLDGFVPGDGEILWNEDPSIGLATAPVSASVAATVPRLHGWWEEAESAATGVIGRQRGLSAPLARLFEAARPPNIELNEGGLAWGGGTPVAPMFGIRTEDGLTWARGERAFDGDLADDERADEAFGWVDGLLPVAYVDARRARAWISLAALSAGISAPVKGLDRMVVGVAKRDEGFSWRLVVSATRANG